VKICYCGVVGLGTGYECGLKKDCVGFWISGVGCDGSVLLEALGEAPIGEVTFCAKLTEG
jgi:hypothetical protein